MAGFCCASARAQSGVVYSSSRQFTARQLQRPASLPALAKPTLMPASGSWAYLVSSSTARATGNTEEVILDPALLVAQCEQVKHLMLAELGMVDAWRGRIDLIINPSLTEDAG